MVGISTVSETKLTLPQPSTEADVQCDSETSSSSSDETDTDFDETSDGDEDEMQVGCECSGNRVFDIAMLNNALKVAANCSVCGSTGTLQVRSDYTARCGIVVPTCFYCTHCGNAIQIESKKVDSPGWRCAYELNSRAALGMRLIGRGRAALRNLCGVMEQPTPLTPTAYQAHTKAIHGAVKAEAHSSLCQAVQNIRDKNNMSHDQIMDLNVCWWNMG